MSRGLGTLQRDILSHVREQGVTTLESLRWELGEGIDGKGNLRKAWSYGVERATVGLAKRGHLTIESRPLGTLREWTRHYPGKTYRGQIRQCRLELLPVLADWVRSDEGPRPLYSADENERFYARGEGGSLAQRLDAMDRGAAFAPEWRLLEPRLREHYAASGSDSLFYLITRGKQLFAGAQVQTRFSLGELIDRCAKENILPDSALVQLRSIADRFLPPEKAGALELKSFIYRFITSVIHGHPDLKPEALDALYKARSDYLRAIPGFNPPRERKNDRFWLDEMRWLGAVEKRSTLARLIDQTTFQRFRFLRPARIASP